MAERPHDDIDVEMVDIDPPFAAYDGPCPRPAEVTHFGDLAARRRVYLCGCGRGEPAHQMRTVYGDG
jgi:hypothetical protein